MTIDEALRQIITDCGEDTEGLPTQDTEGLIAWAVRAVKQLREDYDECLEEAA